MWPLAAPQRQLAGIQAAPGDLDQGIGAALHGRTLVVPRTGSEQPLERRLEGGASFGIEMAVEIVTAIPGLGEPHPASAMVLLLLAGQLVGVQLVAQAPAPQKEVARAARARLPQRQCL